MGANALDSEDQKYWDDVKAVKEWWNDSRWRYTKRPFSAEQIVAKRGNLKIQYPSNVMSKKLWGLVEDHFKVGEWTAYHQRSKAPEKDDMF
jgi:isocitrate lyase